MTFNKTGSAGATEPVGRSDLGRRIAQRRQVLGLSREEVGERSGAAPSYIAYLEERAAQPGRGVMLRLADALSTSVGELAGTTVDLPPGGATAARDAELVPLDEAECRRLLSTHGVGRVATYNAEGPAVLPVNYVVAGTALAFRTSPGVNSPPPREPRWRSRSTTSTTPCARAGACWPSDRPRPSRTAPPSGDWTTWHAPTPGPAAIAACG